ncbi:MAG: hypothetical protein LBT83_00050 [Tannerella sp.]|jgi:hypothetical protein|nr:hypothetical protein [Tannerella sp.]
MNTKKLFLIIVCSCFLAGAWAQEAAVSIELSEAQKKFQNELTTFLKEEGFTLSMSENAHRINFNNDSIPQHWILIQGESPYFVIMGRGGFSLQGEDAYERHYAILVGNEISKSGKAVKMYCTEQSAILQIEQYTHSAEDFKYAFYPAIRELASAHRDFIPLYNQMKAIPPVDPVLDPKPQPDRNTGNIVDRMQKENPTLYLQYRNANKQCKMGRVFLISGGVLAVVGLAALSNSGVADDAAGTVGTIGVIVGTACVAVGLPNTIIGGSRKRRALRTFNREKSTSHFQINLNGNGIGLACMF